LGRDDLVGMRMQYLKICVVTKMKTWRYDHCRNWLTHKDTCIFNPYIIC
jgi:hypothetical protein